MVSQLALFYKDSTDNSSSVCLIIAIIIGTIIITLGCREIVCWYWKINKTMNILLRIEDRLFKIHKALDKVEDTDNSLLGIEEEKQDYRPERPEGIF